MASTDGLSPAAMIVGAGAIRSALAYAALHKGDPGNGGSANIIAGPLQKPLWSTPTDDGDWELASPIKFTGMTPNTTVTHMSLWSINSTSTGIWYGNFPLSGDNQTDSNGEYTVDSMQFDGASVMA